MEEGHRSGSVGIGQAHRVQYAHKLCGEWGVQSDGKLKYNQAGDFLVTGGMVH